MSRAGGAYMWSAVTQAYHQLCADPLAMPLFGIIIEGKRYMDIALSFGCRTLGADQTGWPNE